MPRAVLLLFLVALPASAQPLTDAQRRERCDNNRQQIAELERQRAALLAPFRWMEDEAITPEARLDELRRNLSVLNRAVMNNSVPENVLDLARTVGIARTVMAGNDTRESVRIVRDATLRAVENQRALLARKDAALVELRRLEEQISYHRARLAELRCDDLNTVGAPAELVAGVWQSDWGNVTLNVSERSVSGSWSQPGAGEGTLTGTYDPAACRIEVSYRQTWDGQEGTAHWELSSDGKLLNGSYRQASSTGSWTLWRDTAPGGCRK